LAIITRTSWSQATTPPLQKKNNFLISQACGFSGIEFEKCGLLLLLLGFRQ
jgi:hypothetical protein